MSKTPKALIMGQRKVPPSVFLQAALAASVTLECIGGGGWPLGREVVGHTTILQPLLPSLLGCNRVGKRVVPGGMDWDCFKWVSAISPIPADGK